MSQSASAGVYSDQYFRNLASKIDTYQRHDRNQIYTDPFLRYLDEGGTILDVATGLSDIPLKLREAGFRTLAIDINEKRKNLDAIRREKYHSRQELLDQVVFYDGDARSLPFEACSIDGVIIKDLLEHYEHNVGLDILAEGDRVLRKGGVLVVGTPSRTPGSLTLRYAKRLFGQTCGVDEITVTPEKPSAHVEWYSSQELKGMVSMVGDQYNLVEERHLLYGIHTFPKFLVAPLRFLQAVVHTKELRNNRVANFFEKNLGFRVMLAYIKS